MASGDYQFKIFSQRRKTTLRLCASARVIFREFSGLLPLLLLAVLVFSGCPQSQDPGLQEIPELPPQAPQNMKVTPGNKRLIVSWDQAAGAASYELFWGIAAEDGEQSKDSKTTMAIVDGLKNGDAYRVKVRSKNSAGLSAFCSAEEATPEIQAPTPSVIRGNAELSVGWAAEDGVTYKVLYGTANNSGTAGEWSGTITVSGSVAGAAITGLDNRTPCYVWIKAQEGAVTKVSDKGTAGTPEDAPQTIPNDFAFAYVSGGTVAGSEAYAMTVTVPSVSEYMNAGRTLSKKGVFVEGRTVGINSFFMAVHETTRELWYEVQSWAENRGTGRYYFQNRIKNNLKEDEKPKPMTGISWRDAIVWCNAYSEMNSLEPVYCYQENTLRDSRNANGTACDGAVMDNNNNGYRLPTEVEREFAARGGDPGKADWMFTYAGSNDADDVAWHHGNSAYTINIVGQKTPNRLDIYDLSGNVQEWGWDWMNYNVAITPDTPWDGKPYGSPNTQKPMAGGGVGSNITMSCVADRWGFSTDYTYSSVGFRVMRKAN